MGFSCRSVCDQEVTTETSEVTEYSRQGRVRGSGEWVQVQALFRVFLASSVLPPRVGDEGTDPGADLDLKSWTSFQSKQNLGLQGTWVCPGGSDSTW